MQGRARRIEAAARALAGAGIQVAACRAGAPGAALFPEERQAVRRAVAARKAEFAAGRTAARAAMAALGLPASPIPMAPDRAPVWPQGVTGTITHTDGLALAAVALRETSRGLGLDIEPDTALPRDLWPSVLTDAEQHWLQARPKAGQGRLAKKIFCVKEATYKAQYAASGTFLEFHDLNVTLTPETGDFHAVFQRDAGPFARGTFLAGRLAGTKGLILAYICLDCARK